MSGDDDVLAIKQLWGNFVFPKWVESSILDLLIDQAAVSIFPLDRYQVVTGKRK